MAGDWIKMRMDLSEDPAVYRLARLTGLDRLSVVGRLHAFWSWADKHAVDGRVDGGASADVDDIVDHPGFAQAMVTVKWLQVGEDFLALPKHDRHNGESAKERSLKNARQARWRDGKDAGDPPASPTPPAPPAPPPTPPSTAPSTEPSTNPPTREEKKREEKKNSPSLRSGEVARPDAIAPELWADYLAVRIAKKGGVVTATALAGLQREAAKAGVSLEQALRTCCELSWVGFNAGWYADRQQGRRPGAPTGGKYAAAAAGLFGKPPQEGDFIDV